MKVGAISMHHCPQPLLGLRAVHGATAARKGEEPAQGSHSRAGGGRRLDATCLAEEAEPSGSFLLRRPSCPCCMANLPRRRGPAVAGSPSSA